jgi:hypothetical protein
MTYAVRQTKWIRYENNRFHGSPQAKKGKTGNWIPVIYLNAPSFCKKKETRVKDENYDICYISYQ